MTDNDNLYVLQWRETGAYVGASYTHVSHLRDVKFYTTPGGADAGISSLKRSGRIDRDEKIDIIKVRITPFARVKYKDPV